MFAKFLFTPMICEPQTVSSSKCPMPPIRDGFWTWYMTKEAGMPAVSPVGNTLMLLLWTIGGVGRETKGVIGDDFDFGIEAESHASQVR